MWPDGPDVHVLLEEMVVVAPLSLGLVHRGVRILDQGIRIVTVLGVDTNANARAYMDITLGDGVRHRKRNEYLLRTDSRNKASSTALRAITLCRARVNE
jgi:hypothetical protein